MKKTRIDRMLCLLPLTFQDIGYCLGNSLSVITATAISILTFGNNVCVNRHTNQSHISARFISLFFRRCIKILNPNTQFSKNFRVYRGFYTGQIKDVFKNHQTRFVWSDNFVVRHVLSRGAYGLMAILAIITRLADLVLGLSAIPLAITGFILSMPNDGLAHSINEFIFENLQFMSVIEDVCDNLRGVINPQQFNLRFNQIFLQ